MLIQKWNPQTNEYEPFESPAKNPIFYTHDMDLQIDCTNCGKEIIFGDSFTSRMIHTAHGFGYPVCTECYALENISLSNNQNNNEQKSFSGRGGMEGEECSEIS